MIQTFISTEIKSINSTAHWHWTKKRRYVAVHKWSVHDAFQGMQMPYPCHVQLVRYGVREMDEDNLYASLKSIRDAIADRIKPGLRPGMADGDKGITWSYAQAKSKKANAGVMITIKPM